MNEANEHIKSDGSIRKIYTCADGCMAEGGDWFIIENEDVSHYSGGKQCKHCHSEREIIHPRLDGSTFKEIMWTCPRVVVAFNEGGNNSTGICLDCILEKLSEIYPNYAIVG